MVSKLINSFDLYTIIKYYKMVVATNTISRINSHVLILYCINLWHSTLYTIHKIICMRSYIYDGDVHAGDLRVVQAAAASSRSTEENRSSVKKVIRSGTGSGRRRAGMSYVRVPRSGRRRKPPRPRPGCP